jgi:dolichol kinase
MKIRNIVAVIAGFSASIIIIIIGEALAHVMNPLPEGVNMNDPESFKAFISNAPVSLHLIILCNYALACFVGSLLSSSIALDKKMNKAISLGGLFMGVGMFSLISLSHPIWVVVFSVFVFLPFAYLGGMLGVRISTQKK